MSSNEIKFTVPIQINIHQTIIDNRIQHFHGRDSTAEASAGDGSQEDVDDEPVSHKSLMDISIPDDLLKKLADKVQSGGMYGEASREGKYRLRWKSLNAKMQSQCIKAYSFQEDSRAVVDCLAQIITALAKEMGKWKRAKRRVISKWKYFVNPKPHVAKCIRLINGQTEYLSE